MYLRDIQKLNKEELVELLLQQSDRENCPEADELLEELKRERHTHRYLSMIKSTAGVLITVIAIAVIISNLYLPVLHIYGSSMTPALESGEIVVAINNKRFQCGDIIAFYYGNKLLVKRCIAGPGDFVVIDESGTVYVNGLELEEPYLNEKSLGECDLDFPFQVAEDKYFVLGDHRSISADSRINAVGCVSADQIVGKIVLRIWPLNRIGKPGV